MSIFRSRRRRAAPQLLWTPIATADTTSAPLVPHASYFRLWLSDVFLARDRARFANRYPAVNVGVKLNLHGHAQPATFTTLARPPESALGPGVLGTFPLTPLLPFRGGTVELSAGLNALEGTSALFAGLDLLRDFSSLVGPPVSQAVHVAQKVTDGAQKLLAATDHESLLAVRQSFAAANNGGGHAVRPGHWAAVNASEDDVCPHDLRIEHERLRVADGDTTRPLVGYDYMLFRIEGADELDDWRLPYLDELIRKAKRAHFAHEANSYRAYHDAAIAEAMTSPDLTSDDQQRVAEAIRDELAATVADGHGTTGAGARDLATIVAERAPSLEEIRARRPRTLEEILESAGQ